MGYDFNKTGNIKSGGAISFAGQSFDPNTPPPDPSKSQLYSQLNQVGQGKVAAFNLIKSINDAGNAVGRFALNTVKNVADTVEAPFKLGQQNQTIDKANQQRQSLTQQFKAGKINKQQFDQGMSGVDKLLGQNQQSIQQSSAPIKAINDFVSQNVTDPAKNTVKTISGAAQAIFQQKNADVLRNSADSTLQNLKQLHSSGKINDQQFNQGLQKINDALAKSSKQLQSNYITKVDPVKAAADAATTFMNVATLGGDGLVTNIIKNSVQKSIAEHLTSIGLDQVAKGVEEQAAKQASRTVLDKAVAGTGKLVKNTTEGAAIGGSYGGLQAASEKGTKTTGKDVLQGIKGGAELGAGLGAGSTVAGGLVKGARGGAGKLIEAAKAPKDTIKTYSGGGSDFSTPNKDFAAQFADDTNNGKVQAKSINKSDVLDTRIPAQRTQLETILGKDKVDAMINRSSNGLPNHAKAGEQDALIKAAGDLGYKHVALSETDAKTKFNGKDVVSYADTKNAIEKATAKVEPSPKVKSPAQEGGFVNPGAVSEDITKAKQAIQSHIEQNQRATKFSGDVVQDAHIHQAESQQRLIDSAKVMKKLQGVSKEDRQAVYDYREAKAAGTELPKLTDNQKALHDTITELAKATNANKAEMIRLKVPGYNKDNLYDPEAGNHRIAIGKGASLERFLTGRQGSPLAARSLRTSTSSNKARIFHAITDEKGNRQVAAINNVSVKQGLRSVSKGKFVTAIDENGKATRLGKITPADIKAGTFKGSDGKTYKLSQATTNEITKATGQKYIKDPLTSAMIDFHETRNALDSARMLEKWKTNPDFENIAMKHGEGLAPKGWKTTHLPQMQGYAFEPKVAEVLDDIHGNIADKNKALATINHYLRNAMVAIPIRHNLNEIGFYFTDRGLSSLINPMAYKRGTQALIKATNEVMNQGPLYRKIVSQGFNFMDQNDKAFADAVMKQTKSMLDDQGEAAKLAGDLGTTVTNLRKAYNAIQHKGVWFQQDVLNMSRIIERMDKGASLEEAVKQTERFNPQYRVPSRVAGSRAVSQVLRNNNALFFGSYHYDQWKTLANMAKDLAGKSGGRAALQAVDKFGALALGIWATHALIDKGLQAFSGNNNAYTKPFGALDFPDQLYQLVTGKKDVNAVLQSQIFPSVGLNVIAQLFENRDFFTGKQIRDPNMSQADQIKQIGDWLDSQNPISQQVKGAGKEGSLGGAAATVALGAHFPKNSPATNQLYQLKYDTLPNIQSQARKQAQAGDIAGAQKTISQYDTLLLAAAKSALRENNKPIPDDNVLIARLKKSQYYYSPKPNTIQKWSTERPAAITDTLGK